MPLQCDTVGLNAALNQPKRSGLYRHDIIQKKHSIIQRSIKKPAGTSHSDGWSGCMEQLFEARLSFAIDSCLFVFAAHFINLK